MNNVDKHARRILAGVRRGLSDERVFPGYVSFDEAPRPAWWKEIVVPDAWGRVLGIHENEPDRQAGSIVITDTGLAALGEGSEVSWLPYSSITGWDKLSKVPVSRSLYVVKDTGERVELLFCRGGAFAFVQFLSCAMREHRRALSHE